MAGRGERGFSLIIVIFAIVLLGGLGWSLASMLATDMDVGIRMFDSQRALYGAEAGAAWCLSRLSATPAFRSDNGDADCQDSADWVTHTFFTGAQYRVCCRNATAVETPYDIIIHAEGYAPTVSGYRAKRALRYSMSMGSLTHAVLTQTADAAHPDQGLFDWSGSTITYINGTVAAGHYEGDGDGVYDEPGVDYRSTGGVLTNLPWGTDTRRFTEGYPTINMTYYYERADFLWPQPATRTITATASASGSTVTVPTRNFFLSADRDNVGVRRADVQQWWEGNNWGYITAVSNQGRTATLSTSVSGWGSAVPIRLVRRVYGKQKGNQRGLYYAGGELAGGQKADMVVDVPEDGETYTNTYFMAEGDILVTGGRFMTRFISSHPFLYPNLGTKDGAIIMTEGHLLPNTIDGAIYSQNGHVDLRYITGTIVMGQRVTLGGILNLIAYDEVLWPEGFVLTPSAYHWREE